MTRRLSFESKVNALLKYHKELTDVDPRSAQFGQSHNSEMFYWGSQGHDVSGHLLEARQRLLYEMQCHARVEYGKKFSKNDLRSDTSRELARRADRLALISQPIESKTRHARAERIASILAQISAGETIRVTKRGIWPREDERSVEVTAELDRPLFGVFLNSHVSSQDLTIQYDTPVTFAPTRDVVVGEPLVNFDIAELFNRQRPQVIVETTND